MVAPLQAGDQYNLACSGPINTPGVTPLFTTDPVQAMYDLFSCSGGPVNGLGRNYGPCHLDYWGSDFNGIGGIAGQEGTTDGQGVFTPSQYYPSVLGRNAFFNRQFHSLYAWRSNR